MGIHKKHMRLLACLLFITTLATSQATQEEINNLQKEVYIIAGVFGGLTIILLLMVLGISFTIARLHQNLQQAKDAESQPKPGVNHRIPDMTRQMPDSHLPPAAHEPRRNEEARFGPQQNQRPDSKQESDDPHSGPRQEKRNLKPSLDDRQEGFRPPVSTEYKPNPQPQPRHIEPKYGKGLGNNNKYNWEPLPRQGTRL